MKFDYEARVVRDDGDGEWFVRLHRKERGNPSDGGEFVGICAANGIHEGEMVAACINAVAKGMNEDAMVLVERMFEWSRFDEPTTGPKCDDCGCPSPDPDTLHQDSGVRICHACEARAAEKAREYEPARDGLADDRCKQCGKRCPNATCPACQEENVRRLQEPPSSDAWAGGFAENH